MSFFDFFFIFPEFFLIISILSLLIFYSFYATIQREGYPILSIKALFISIYICLCCIILYIAQPETNLLVLISNILISNYIIQIKILLCILHISVLVGSIMYIKTQRMNAFEYQVLLLLALLGQLALVSANTLALLFVALELQTLSFYIVTAAHRNSEISAEAGLKYFIFGAFSSGLVLFGLSILYATTGLNQLDKISQVLIHISLTEVAPIGAIYLGCILIVLGFIFKLYVVPFHVWIPDIYQGAPTVITLYFATIPSLALNALLLRIIFIFSTDLTTKIQELLLFLAISSMVIGCIGAIFQTNLKRILAFSAVSNVGFIFLGIGISSYTAQGLISVFLYQIIYIGSILLFLSCCASIIKKQTNKSVLTLRDLVNLSKEHPLLGLTIASAVFSMAGFPPLAGFFSKLYIFNVLIEHSLFTYFIIGVLVSTLGAFYYLRIVRTIYFTETQVWTTYKTLNTEVAYALSIYTFLLYSFIFESSWLLNFCTKLSLLLTV
jgi:NADH-quinone oxidoreductase subunit N